MLSRLRAGPKTGDVLAVAQKVVSKAEGRIERTDDYHGRHSPRGAERPDAGASELGDRPGNCPTRSVCASAGVDRSNAPDQGTLVLLPVDPDASARSLRDGLGIRFGIGPAVIVSDSFGRAWRQGTTDVVIGVAGQVLRPGSIFAAPPTGADTVSGVRRRRGIDELAGAA